MKNKAIYVSVLVLIYIMLSIFTFKSGYFSVKSNIKIENYTGVTSVIGKEQEYYQTFFPNKDTYGLAIKLATYQSTISSDYYLNIYDDTNTLIAQETIVGKRISDNSFYNVYFSKPLSKDKKYIISISAKSNTTDTLVVYKANYADENIFSLCVDKNKMEECLAMIPLEYGVNFRLIVFVILSVVFSFSLFWLLASEEYKEIIEDFLIGTTQSNEKKVVICVIYFIISVFFVGKMQYYSNQIGGFPDEVAHISYIAYLEAENKLIPEFENMQVINSTQEPQHGETIHRFKDNTVNYLGHPPLYYQVMKISGGIDVQNNGNIVVNYSAIRNFSQAIAYVAFLIVLYLGYSRINRLILQVLYGAVAVSIPMVSFISAGINNDTMAFLGVSIFVLGLLRFHEDKKNIVTFLIISIGTLVSLLSKLTAGAIVVVTIFAYLVYLLYIEKSLKRVFCKEFFCTLPIYLVAVLYYGFIFIKYKTFSISLATLDYDYYVTTRFYVEPEERIVYPVFQFLEWFIDLFLETWVSWISDFKLVKDINILSLETIALIFVLISVFVCLFFNSKNKETIVQPIKAFSVGIVATMLIEVIISYRSMSKVGYLGGCHSRYFYCALCGFAFCTVLVFEYLYKIISKMNCKRKGTLYGYVVFTFLFIIVLLYEDFGWFLLNYTN